jgi:hypothetical protein
MASDHEQVAAFRFGKEGVTGIGAISSRAVKSVWVSSAASWACARASSARASVIVVCALAPTPFAWATQTKVTRPPGPASTAAWRAASWPARLPSIPQTIDANGRGTSLRAGAYRSSM